MRIEVAIEGEAPDRPDAATGRAPLRLVSAASLFDGHDAAINLIRRLLQAEGAEVVHLGHNRSVEELVRAAIEEDVDWIGVSTLSGAHMVLLPKLRRLLDEQGASDIRILAGGIVPQEDIPVLQDKGVAQVFLSGTSIGEIVEYLQRETPLERGSAA